MGKGPDATRMPNATWVLVQRLDEPKPGADPKIYEAEWSRMGDWTMPEMFLKSSRLLEIIVKGENECEFRSHETFNGPGAYIIKNTMSGALLRAFEEWGEGLKEASEKKFAEMK